ncbi:MAG: sulfite exporter TauE/SafE family protein [Halobacteriota archaeon]
MTVEAVDIGVLSWLILYGLGIGVLFGFLGVGGSLLTTPAFLVLGVPPRTAVGSGLAFVFGTSLISAINHRHLGSVDRTLAAPVIAGMTAGILIGERLVRWLVTLGNADTAISIAFVGILGAIGMGVIIAHRGGQPAQRIADRVPRPTVSGSDSKRTCVGSRGVTRRVLATLGFGTGVLSGLLGIGGGLVLVPLLSHGVGVPAAIAVGTATIQIVVASAVGTFVFALGDAVDLSVVVALLVGSTLGARLGAVATVLLPAPDHARYLGWLLLAASGAVGVRVLGATFGVVALELASAIILFGTTILAGGGIALASIASLRREVREGTTSPEELAVRGPDHP